MENSGTFVCVIYKHHQTVSVIDESMSVEYWWNDTNRGIPKYSENKPSEWQCLPKIPHGLTWKCNPVSAVRGRRLTARVAVQRHMYLTVGC